MDYRLLLRLVARSAVCGAAAAVSRMVGRNNSIFLSHLLGLLFVGTAPQTIYTWSLFLLLWFLVVVPRLLGGPTDKRMDQLVVGCC